VKLHILAVGDRVPRWVSEACADYMQRFPPHCPVSIKAVPTPRRGRNPDIARLKQKEFQSMSAGVPKGAPIIALQENGRAWTTDRLARNLESWMHTEKDVAFLIGGPDGHAPAALETAREKWSLSALTLPHALVRIIVVEQLYRALSILSDHPYHRGH
jgi:23S rRNA (pseudouridine1915-N3)-methyltransferase